MRTQIGAAMALSVALAACGGSTDDDTTDAGGGTTTGGGSSIEDVTGLGPADVIATDSDATRIGYDADTDEIIVEAIPFDDDAFEGRYARTPGLDRGNFEAYTATRGFDTYVAFFDTSTSGSVSATIVNSNAYADHGYFGAGYTRESTVALPSSTQRAFYSGDYVGLRTNGEGAGEMDTITGDIRFEADFSDAVVRGQIVNRVVVLNETGTGAGNTITLANTSLNTENGTFKGQAGEAAGGLDGAGTYEGVIGGPNGEEVAGVVILTTQANLRETGAFIAEQ